MSLSITPYPTARALALAMSNLGEMSIKAKYIGVGSGFQSLAFDDAGALITDTMAEPVAWVEIMNAERISDYQHQLTVDLAGVANEPFNLSEIVLADENKQAISLYSHASQALMAITPQIDHAFVAINMLFATFPANSIEIIHNNVPMFYMQHMRDRLVDEVISLAEKRAKLNICEVHGVAMHESPTCNDADICSIGGYELTADPVCDQPEIIEIRIDSDITSIESTPV